jgi:hypothetical protein
MRANSCLVSAWITGNHSQVSNSLSRDTDLSDDELTCLLLLHASSSCLKPPWINEPPLDVSFSVPARFFPFSALLSSFYHYY